MRLGGRYLFRSWGYPVLLAGLALGFDAADRRVPFSVLATGAIDEPAHLATAALGLLALACFVDAPRRFYVAALIASVAIDLDHITEYLGLMGHQEGRPFTHSLATVVVVVVAAAVSRRHRAVLAGTATGLLLHFARDIAEGSPGVRMLWPLSQTAWTASFWWFLGMIVAFTVVRLVMVTGPAHSASVATMLKTNICRRWGRTMPGLETHPVGPVALDADLTNLTFWARPPAERMAAFARLREQDKPVFFAEQRVPLLRSGTGFYALVRHSDVTEASRNPRIFSSEPAATSPEPPRWVHLVFGTPMVNMDDPGHARLRRIVARAFTPRRLAALDELIGLTAARIVDEMAAQGPGNFVTQVARRLPGQMIGAMMGIPERYQDLIAARVAAMTEYSGVRADVRRLGTLRLMAGNLRSTVAFRRLFVRIGRERRREPGDDLISALVTANVDGERLSLRELCSFFDLLMVASTETTTNAIAHGLHLFTRFPDQRDLLTSDFDTYIGGAVEEIVRYASPIIQFRRTLTRDYEMRGHAFAQGDKVVMFYLSANHDDAVFDRPDEFDITRHPNPHVGFGGGGPHQCIGAHLARREVTAIFRELFTRFPEIRATGEPEWLLSYFDNGITHLGFDLGRADSGAPSRATRAGMPGSSGPRS